MVFIYITCKNDIQAKKISKHLLLKKLIACANIFPIDSLYMWKGKLCEGKETVILAKTIKSKFVKLNKEIVKIHSYDIPCVCMIESKDNKKYLDWMKKEVR